MGSTVYECRYEHGEMQTLESDPNIHFCNKCKSIYHSDVQVWDESLSDSRFMPLANNTYSDTELRRWLNTRQPRIHVEGNDAANRKVCMELAHVLLTLERIEDSWSSTTYIGEDAINCINSSIVTLVDAIYHATDGIIEEE